MVNVAAYPQTGLLDWLFFSERGINLDVIITLLHSHLLAIFYLHLCRLAGVWVYASTCANQYVLPAV